MYSLIFRKPALDDEQPKAKNQRTTMLEICAAFTSATKQGPDYICTCCNRLNVSKGSTDISHEQVLKNYLRNLSHLNVSVLKCGLQDM